MKPPEKIVLPQFTILSQKNRSGIIIKGLALSIPAIVMIAGLCLSLRDDIRQALVGVILIWLYAGAMSGFGFLE